MSAKMTIRTKYNIALYSFALAGIFFAAICHISTHWAVSSAAFLAFNVLFIIAGLLLPIPETKIRDMTDIRLGMRKSIIPYILSISIQIAAVIVSRMITGKVSWIILWAICFAITFAYIFITKRMILHAMAARRVHQENATAEQDEEPGSPDREAAKGL